MDILLLLIPLSLLFICAAIVAFRWAVKTHQFDDLDSPGMIPLLDDTEAEKKQQQKILRQEDKPT